MIQRFSGESDRTAADLFILRGDEPAGGELRTALQTFFKTDDGGVEAVLVGGQCVYGEDAFLEKMTGGDLSAYGKYETEKEELQGKSFLFPEIFEGSTIDEVYDAYTALLDDVGIEMSAVRRLEDPVYIEGITRVLSLEK